MSGKKGLIKTALFLMALFFSLPVPAAAGSVEIRIDRATLQSFIAAAFPLTIRHEIVMLGAFKAPIAVVLSNPGEIRFCKEEQGAPAALDLAMDYELTGLSGLIPPSRGRVGGKVSVTVSPEEEHLLLTFSGIELAISPVLRLFISPLSQPVKVPLPKTIPVKIHDKTVFGRFHHLALRLEADVLIVKGEVAFSASATPPPANPGGEGRPSS